MVDIIGVVFKRFASALHVSSDMKLSCESECSALVVGDEKVTRSLLFLSAVTAASEMEMKVLFFTQTQIQSLPVILQTCPGSPPLKTESLKKIKFVYPRTLEELLEDVASLHELVNDPAPLPSLIIVDGLEKYVSVQDRLKQDARSMAAHTVALLHDTATFLTQNLNTRAEENQLPCRIMVSYQPERKGQGESDGLVPDPPLSVLERYLQVKCTFEKVTSTVEQQNKWLLHLSGPRLQVNGVENVEKDLELRWHMAQQPNGALEFWPETAPKAETSQEQNTMEVKKKKRNHID
ncbi:ATPase SWSAP1 [Trichomycterus rosablanca]|uniref:ATPase SWSAP1 n=1 Tax=Trichomycterus rosablanca TaxID=2290929 RepID=UPI002F3589BE